LKTDRRANKFTYNDETDNFNQPQYQLINEWQVNPNLLATSALYYIKGDGYYEQFKSARKFSDYGLSAFKTSDSTTYPKPFYDSDVSGYVKIGADGKYTVKRTDLVRQKALDLSDVGWIPSMEWKHPHGTLSIGGEIRRNTGRHFGMLVWAAALPQGAQPGSLYYDYLGYRNLYSAYVREQYFVLPDLNVQAAVQLQHSSYGVKNDDFSKHDYSLSYTFLTPRLGVNYNVTSEVNLFGNYSIVKREPTLNDIHNEGDPLFKTMIPGVQYSDPLLKPETLHDYELGVGYTTPRLKLKANGYLMDFREELVFGGQINSVGEPILGNAEQTIHRGIELSATVLPIAKLTLSGNLTLSKNYFVKYTEHTYDTDALGNYLSYVRDDNSIANFPDVIANARALYEYGEASIALTMQHVGRQFIDNSENEKNNVAAHVSSNYIDKVVNMSTVFNFSFAYELRPFIGLRGVRASLFVNNIFNRKYEYMGHIGYDDGASRWFPAAARNYFAQLEFNF
jgi:iron complex outermembrane receptor protein